MELRHLYCVYDVDSDIINPEIFYFRKSAEKYRKKLLAAEKYRLEQKFQSGGDAESLSEKFQRLELKFVLTDVEEAINWQITATQTYR